MNPISELGRIGRLCMKELRESLRDRRTVITLVLMPLLVYPLLSLILNRVLIQSATAESKQVVRFGIGSELETTALKNYLMLGNISLYDSDHAPVYTLPTLSASGTNGSSEVRSALPEITFIPIGNDPYLALQNGLVDLVITGKQRGHTFTEAEEQVLSAAVTLPKELLEVMGSNWDNLSAKDMLNGIGDYEVLYRLHDPTSERALQILERTLGTINSSVARALVGNNFEAPFRLLATPVSYPSSYGEMLATLIPLVLVLMTMAGAVYPAIDLTAGERERGTMEALIVSPTHSYWLLFAKYVAVVTVSMLTALANLLAMTITLWASGIGKLIFGSSVLSTGLIGQILALLILFTTFFSAILLAITSFARSFKEAQAYLIPVMLLALAPGVMSLLPGIVFTRVLASVPLVNIVLLARDVLTDSVTWNTASVAVLSTATYAAIALFIASNLFGSEASLQGSQGSWGDLIQRPFGFIDQPSLNQMSMTMLILFPIYFVASSVLPSVSNSLSTRLWIATLVSWVLVFGLPWLVCWYRRIRFKTTFLLADVAPYRWPIWLAGVVLIALSMWTMAHEVVIFGKQLYLESLDESKLRELSEFRLKLRQLPFGLVLLAFAITPAVCEEFFFRGFVLSSLRKYRVSIAILVSSILFGLMHVVTSQVLAVERFMPSTLIGLVLAWVAYRTNSIWPGVVLHCIHNSLLLSLNHFEEYFSRWDYVLEESQHLPASWLIGGALATCVGLAILSFSTKPESSTSTEGETLAAS